MKNPSETKPPLTDKKEAILKTAANLFARRGYAGVSIRDLAQEIHTTPAALYHHFQDKDAIYFATLQYVFSDKVTAVSDLVRGDDAPEIKLEKLIVWLIRQFGENPIMVRLLQRELLDGDKVRTKFLTEEVIAAPLHEIQNLMQQLAPERDARISAVSVFSLILGFFELSPVLEHLTGQRNTRKNLLAFAGHAKHLVLHGLMTNPQPEEI